MCLDHGTAGLEAENHRLSDIDRGRLDDVDPDQPGAYNTSIGQALEWLMNGTSVIGGGSPGSAPSPWTIVGQGDFNGDGFFNRDGNSDILWYNANSAQAVVWLLSGASLIGGGSPGSAASP